jgi:UDP-N-acetylglucosamine acyltransferase
MARTISPRAEVDPRAQIADDVFIGPFCVIGPDVSIGPGCRLDSHVAIVGHTAIGAGNRFFPNCVIGAEPQDYAFSGAPTRVEIGEANVFREGVTVHRGAEKEDGITRIGNRNLLMANSHVAHNCHVHDNVVLVNGVLLGGHVHVHDYAIISGNAVVHHFATLGTLCFVSGGCRVPNDVPPYMLAVGSDDPRILTVNLVGMQRRGIAPETISRVRRVHRLIFREFKTLDSVRNELLEESGGSLPIEVVRLLDFLDRQKDGRQGRQGEARRHKAPETDTQTNRTRRAA